MANTAVYGIYSSRQDAEMAIDSMRAAGFRAADISVLFPDNEGTKDIGHEKHTKAPEKATAGAAIAGIAGGTIGWLAGIGALAIPGIGPFVAAGPIMAALAGLGAGSVVGGLTGALIGAGIPEYEAKRYEGRIRSGGILLSVHCEDDHLVKRAKEMLRHTGAEDIASAEEGRVRGGKRDESRDTRDPLETRDHPVTTAPVATTPVADDRRTVIVEDRRSVGEERPVADTRRVIRDEPLTRPADPVIVERRTTDTRIVDQDRFADNSIDNGRSAADTRRVVSEERVVHDDRVVRDADVETEEELRRRLDPPGRTELL